MKYTIDNFIKRAREIHGNKYDYSKVEYVNNHTKVCIVCPIHGEFWQTPNKHLIGHACHECSKHSRIKNKTMSLQTFIQISKQVHGDKYDYSKVEYVDSQTKVCIICPKHGEFWQTPNNHLSGHGCRKCQFDVLKAKFCFSKEEFIEKAKEIHGDKYDYSKVEYVNYDTKVCIICPIHGEFWQTPQSHLSKNGCLECGGRKKITTKQFIEKSRKVHGNKYDYSKVEYKNNSTKVCIICPIHGEFWQTPSMHSKGQGCPFCKTSKLENEMHNFLEDKISFEEQKRFKWLGKQSLDFFIPSKKIAIECQGKQHFNQGGWSSDIEKCKRNYKKTLERDLKKRKLCDEHGITILYYSNLGIEYPYKVFEDKNELLKKIMEG